jgi:hypothetical protein
LFGHAVLQADAGHDAHALRLDEDLALGAFSSRADDLAEVVVGAAEPVAVPAGRLDDLGHRGRGIGSA